MYNLPPGRNNNNNGLGEILVGILTIVGVIAFFASPLGALVFAFFNSILVLSFTIPIVLFVAFQAWQFFNTVQGPCPSCGTPVRVLKDSSPGLCFNCGSIVQANGNGRDIDFASDTDVLMDEMTDDSFLGGGGFFDNGFRRTTITETTTTTKENKDKFRRERTIIDVDVEDD